MLPKDGIAVRVVALFISLSLAPVVALDYTRLDRTMTL